MLSTTDNDALTRVGPGTMMGELMRRYWVPAILSRELESDGDTLRIFFYGRINDFLHRPVVPKMDDFHAGGLENAPHDVD